MVGPLMEGNLWWNGYKILVQKFEELSQHLIFGYFNRKYLVQGEITVNSIFWFWPEIKLNFECLVCDRQKPKEVCKIQIRKDLGLNSLKGLCHIVKTFHISKILPPWTLIHRSKSIFSCEAAALHSIIWLTDWLTSWLTDSQSFKTLN